MKTIQQICADADSLYAVAGPLKGQDNIVAKVQSKLNWPDDRLTDAVKELEADGRVTHVLLNYDGGVPSVDTFEVR